MKTLQQCLAEYRARKPTRLKQAQQLIDGRLTSSNFPGPQWEWFDVKAEATRMKSDREQAQRKALEDRMRREEHNRSKKQLGLNL